MSRCLLLFLPLAAAAVACSTSAPEAEEVADAQSGLTEGVVVVERAASVSVDATVQTNVSAKFMRLSSPVDTDLAERVVGAKLDLPDVGTCRIETAAQKNARSSPRDTLGTIQLLDVGDLTLAAGTARLALGARAFPEVGDLVSGMFYTSPDSAADLLPGSTWTLEGTGAGAVERFTVEAEGPATPEDIRVAGQALNDSLTLGARRPTPLQWNAQGRGDQMVVDVDVPGGGSVRCTFKDEGAATLPAWVVSDRALGRLPATGTLRLHRFRKRAFASAGIDVGELRFDLSVVGHVTFGSDAPTPPAP